VAPTLPAPTTVTLLRIWFVIDGLDLIACYEATRQGIDHARQVGPVLVEMKLERFMPHTTDDDDRRYRDRDALDAARQYDPALVFPVQMLERGIVTQEQLDAFHADAQQQVNDATDFADAAAPPDATTIYDHLYI
jgi:2-oxoisovalerate dehydrogenase E1 component alpha subunit